MSKLSKSDIKKIFKMREEGLSWKKIQGHFRVSYHVVKSAVDPEYAKKRAEENARRNRVINTGVLHDKTDRSFLPRSLVEERRAWQDREDYRDLTGILLGDPPTGRSAWDQRKDQEAAE